MRRLKLLQRVSWQHVLIAIGTVMALAFICALWLANQHSDERLALQERTQDDNRVQIEALTWQLDKLTREFADSKAETERARAQANASVGQLLQAGETPIIAAPEVVTVPTTPIPVTTTTTVARSSTTTTTEPLPPTTTTTEPPLETTTTEAPTAEPPPETSTPTEVP